jgi:16S rRNA (cytosine1402-N4)-methyltransferase
MAVAQNVHTPVLLSEVVDVLAIRDNGIYVDGTFGAGGYSRGILQSNDTCHVYGIDRDPEAVVRGQNFQKEFPHRFTILHNRFSRLQNALENEGIEQVDGVTFDLGVSSPQLDEAERGFSFSKDAPLDMRMEKSGPTAADFINNANEQELADTIYLYGEERYSRRIAKKIVETRKESPITRTKQLADLVRSVVRKSGNIDPATRTFQALRIKVNEELRELEEGLEAAERVLKPGGRLAVVTFHSLEDRIVKRFLNDRSGKGQQTNTYRHMPLIPNDQNIQVSSFKVLERRGVTPEESEIKNNPRARSARLRFAERTNAPVWKEGGQI